MPLASTRGLRKRGSTYKVIVSATDGLLGARSTSSQTDARDRTAAEPEETVDSGKGDPEQSAEVVKRCGGRLQRGPWLAQKAKVEGVGKSHSLGKGAALL